MINYFDWPKRRISVTSLKLDTQNPRLTEFGKKPSQSEIIEYLIEKEEVVDLAKSIIAQGYFLNEQPIVTKEDDKFVVLEGNRRVAACKILINPDLIKNANKRSSVKAALKKFDLDIIAKLEVIVSPSRKDADIMIVNRHTLGSVVRKWDKPKQDRFIYNRFEEGESIEEMADKFAMPKSEIKKALHRYNVFIEIAKLDLSKKQKDIINEDSKFSMTNVERVFDSKYGREFLGLEFDDKGKVVRKLPVTEYNKRLTKVVEEVIAGKITSRTLNKEEQKKTYFEKLIQSDDFDHSIKPNVKYNQEFIEQEAAPSPVQTKESSKKAKTVAAEDKLIPGNVFFVTNNTRIDDIFNEIKGLSLKKNSNSVSVLLRSYVDMVTYQFLKTVGGITDLIRLEGEKLNKENDRVISSTKTYILALGVKESKIDNEALRKALKLSGSVRKDFIPSLRFMLEHVAKSEYLEEPKLKHSLQSYINKDSKVDKIIGHNEFNLLVHNEYYTNDKSELKAAWQKLEPILDFMVSAIKEKK